MLSVDTFADVECDDCDPRRGPQRTGQFLRFRSDSVRPGRCIGAAIVYNGCQAFRPKGFYHGRQF